MELISTFFLGIIAGVVTGIIPRLLNEKYIEAKQDKIAQEKKDNLSKAFIYEITMNHKHRLSDLLLTYRKNWSEGLYDEPSLKGVYSYPDAIYDTHSKELEHIFEQTSAVQIHFYYWNIKQLNSYAKKGILTEDKGLVSEYFRLALETYRSLFGLLKLLTNYPEAHEEFMGILNNAEDYLRNIEGDINIFKDYRQHGMVDVLENIKKKRS